jgi:hypothetical protein
MDNRAQDVLSHDCLVLRAELKRIAFKPLAPVLEGDVLQEESTCEL